MNRPFEENLDKLRSRLIRMGSLVEEQVEFALKALLENNIGLASVVVERDDKVDKLDLKIDKQCQRIFALNQPVASDLRLLLSAIKINNELERIGDMAGVIAKIYIAHPETAALAQELNVEPLCTSTHKVFKSSIDSFINNDPELAVHILPTDSTIRDTTKRLQEDLIEYMKVNHRAIEAGSHLLLILHHLARITDHATNIAENVIFLVRAKLVRHSSVNKEGIDLNDILDDDFWTEEPDDDDA